jgi:WD40 repeat protein
MRGSKKKDSGDFDSDSELGSDRLIDGSDARVFRQAIAAPGAGGGYIPHHKEPPRYIRVKAHNKKTREFDRMFLAQELIGTRGDTNLVSVPSTPATPARPFTDQKDGVSNGDSKDKPVAATNGKKKLVAKPGGAIWAAEFSHDGKYLAAAGRDRVVRVWAVISTAEERKAHEEEETLCGGHGERLSAPVFQEKPVREFEDHTGDVLDLSWSKNNFLLSSSMDKTVRLWHVSRKECLCTFKHRDLVTRLAFHPRDDRFFLAGSLDMTLRLWSIPDKAVAYSAQLPDMITAVAFSPDGKTAIAGILTGLCLFFETEGLKLLTQIHVRSSRGKNAKGSKITGIQTMAVPPSSLQNGTTPSSTDAHEVKVLITSNDSRIRIYSMRDKTLDVKFKGHENVCCQIASTFSDDGKYVICGSEDGKAFIWSMSSKDSENKDKHPCETFTAHGDMVTTALFAPTKTRMLLGAGGDPIYELCNPPPVTLMSLSEAASASASQVALSVAGDGDGDHHATIPPSSSVATFSSNRGVPSTPTLNKKVEESPAYVARSKHYDGNILVTTDDTGIIKVFRQDCAFAKRKLETWETGSAFSRMVGASGFISGGPGMSSLPNNSIDLRRSISVLSKNSGASSSRRGSVGQHTPSAKAGGGSLGSPGINGSFANDPGSPDHILSWRQGIEGGTGDKRTSGSLVSIGTPTARSERSVSPNKAAGRPGSSAVNLASEARKLPYAGSPATGNSPAVGRGRRTNATDEAKPQEQGPSRPNSSWRSKSRDRKLVKERDRDREREERTMPPVPGFSFRSARQRDGDEPVVPDVLVTQERPAQNGNADEQETDEGDIVDPASPGANASYSFWNLNRWRNRQQQAPSGGKQHTRSTSEGGALLSSNRAAAPAAVGIKDKEKEKDKDKDKSNGVGRRKSFGAGMLSRSQSRSRLAAAETGEPDAAEPSSPERSNSRRRRKTTSSASPYHIENGRDGETDGLSTVPPVPRLPPGISVSVSIVSESEPAEPSTTAAIMTSNLAPTLNGLQREASPSTTDRRFSSSQGGGDSVLSKLSSEISCEEDAEERRRIRQQIEDDDEEMRCSKCGSTEFRASRKPGGGQKLICGRCGFVVG